MLPFIYKYQYLLQNEKLMKFLFSDLSFILTGNDNDGEENIPSIKVSYAHDEYYKGN